MILEDGPISESLTFLDVTMSIGLCVLRHERDRDGRRAPERRPAPERRQPSSEQARDEVRSADKDDDRERPDFDRQRVSHASLIDVFTTSTVLSSVL